MQIKQLHFLQRFSSYFYRTTFIIVELFCRILYRLLQLWGEYIFLLLCSFFFAAALLLKPFTIFFFLPVGFIAREKYGKKMFSKFFLWVILLLSIIPLVLWRIWIAPHPEGIPQSNWLFNGGNIRF